MKESICILRGPFAPAEPRVAAEQGSSGKVCSNFAVGALVSKIGPESHRMRDNKWAEGVVWAGWGLERERGPWWGIWGGCGCPQAHGSDAKPGVGLFPASSHAALFLTTAGVWYLSQKRQEAALGFLQGEEGTASSESRLCSARRISQCAV